MRKWLAVLASPLAICACLVAASPAAAATEFGDTCVGNSPAIDSLTLTSLSNPASSLPLSAPASGVITKVKINVDPTVSLPFTAPDSVKVMKPAGGNNFTVVSQTPINVGAGTNVAESRVPVQVGDRLGVGGEPFSFSGSPIPGLIFYCEESSGGEVGVASTDVSPGSTAEFLPEAEGGVPIVATIEPDADGDGYGDETQDKCPQSATTQAPCPTVVLNASASARGGFATLLVTSTVQASVTVAGKAKLGKGKSAKLSGGTQIVAPGALAKFTIPFTGKLKSALKKLSSKQSLKLKLTASAPNIVGAPTVSKATVKVKGQAKPKKKGSGSHK